MAAVSNGPVPNITFDQNANTRFFMCRRCTNHILSYENYLYLATMAEGIGLIIQNPVNVRASDISTWRFFHQMPVVTVRCDTCKKKLGKRFVMGVANLPPHAFGVIQEGRYLFYPDRMLFWNGTQVVYTHTGYPVENNGIEG